MLSKVLYGRKGCDFDSVIKPFVRQALCTGSGKKDCSCYSCSLSLSSHPDYKFYDQEKYSVEEVDEIIAYAEGIPTISSNRVVVLKNLSGVTEISQNKLLKELEDNKHFVFLATESGEVHNILPTISSRTEAVHISSESSFCDFQTEFDASADLLYRISNKNLGLSREMRELVSIYSDIEDALISADSKRLFSCLNLVKGKDKDCYFSKYRQYIPVLFDFMAGIATNSSTYNLSGEKLDRAVKLLRVINNEKAKCLCSWYDMSNFFVSIVNIAQAL